jgi:hypothetical protein
MDDRKKGVQGRSTVISEHLTLTPVRIGTRWYIEWAATSGYHGWVQRNRWTRFRRKHVTGRDKRGAYFKDPRSVIRAFAKAEKERVVAAKRYDAPGSTP